MAPVMATVNLSHIPGVSDSARARELYKYYQPSTTVETALLQPNPAPSTREDEGSFAELNVQSNVASSKISSPDTALTAFAQLVAWRTGSQRAMISLIDGATQHFVAESTKTLDLVDSTRHAPGDDLWIGCTDVPKTGRLCERTIEVEPTTPGSFPMFIVSDLTKDERFNQLPFVTGKPFLKFYAGTPLITKRGIPIGSLFVVDDRMRTGLSIEETHFMGTMACTIMRHLEMVREVEERRRGMKMSRGLASFVEGRSQLVEEDLEADNEGVSVAGQFAEEDIVPTPKSKSRASNRPSRTPSKASSVSSIEQKEREYSEALSKKEEAIMVSGRDVMTTGTETSRSSDRPTTLLDSQPQSYDEISMSVPSPTTESSRKLAAPLSPGESEASVMKALFSRAANLIREAFEVDGGSVFFDAQKGFTTEYTEEEEEEVKAESPISPEDPMGRYEDIRANNAAVKDDPNKFPRPARQTTFSANFASRNQMFSRPGISDRTVEILGFSTPQASSLHGDPDPSPQVFSRFGQKSLHALLRRYPRGKLWTFDEDGAVSSSEEDGKPLRRPTTGANQQRQKKKDSRPTQEAKILLRHFPGVRQLLFVPLWDSARSRWLSANFTWSNELTRILTKQSELNFLTAFGNSVMAECSRIDTEIADQKKGDFIGSISHELRSPLHGILASAEFLGEEVTEGFSKGLVETIDSCGRTLLDTINHILDFSKINHFEKNWRRSRRGVSGSSRLGPPTASSLALRQADLPMINLFTELDISIVCEEVVEGIFAGHVFQNVTAPSFDMVPDSRGRMSDPKKYVASSDPMMEDLNVHSAETAVILDIDIQDYHFTTQPGAFRRIIMNTVGNALKYTSHGYVRIQLEAVEMDDFVAGGGSETIPRSCVTLTVTDTGKGISSEFLRSHLFTPFAQENSLSSGTGLGLSIVRSIVALLEGEIQIKSEVGRGTEVKVTLPLLREMPKDSSGSTPKSISSMPKDVDEVVDLIRARVIGKTVALHGFNSVSTDQIQAQTRELLKASVSNFLANWYGLKIVPSTELADIIVVNEPNAADIANLTRRRKGERRGPAVLALCSHSSRFAQAHSSAGQHSNLGFLAKPIGPIKLARAISQCLDGLPVTTPGIGPGSANTSGSSEGSNDLSAVFEDMSLAPIGGNLLDNSRMAAGSDNARKAIESPTPTANGETTKEFPFPVDARVGLSKSKSLPGDTDSLINISQVVDAPSIPTASVVLSDMEKTAVPEIMKDSGTPSVSIPKSSMPSPRLLLVDDNKINLHLLRTYMHRKRKYDGIDEAENGLEAVKAVESHAAGYDIIFMDISMPILDGFGATRKIREIEATRMKAAKEKGTANITPALVIALTGLASARDQSEAFTSGVDLFLTKPVSFKEVGKMLDNWEANRERDSSKADESPNIVIKAQPVTEAAVADIDGARGVVQGNSESS